MVTAIPISIRLTILLVILSEHTINFMIPTYIAYMMQGFIEDSTSSADLEASISYHTGLIEGLNRFMSFFGCFFWGIVSDKLGRKHSLQIVLIGVFISSIGFGLSTSFYMALSWRMFAGLFSGTVPILKAMLRDLTDDSNFAVLYSYFGTGYGLASIIGPLVGGLASHPSEKLEIFNTGFFQDFPYFLPQILQ